MSNVEIRLIATEELAAQCTLEQKQQLQGHACHELLRRALEERVADAWNAFDLQFGALLTYWATQEAARYGFANLDEEELADLRSDGVARFIERYANRFSANFEHIGAALSVLHKCIASCAQERYRRRQRAQKLDSALQQAAVVHERGDLSMLDQMALDELRRCIQELLYGDVPEEHLRKLIELRFALDLKPRQIAAHDPVTFPSVDYVNDQIDRLLKRLRRRIDIYTRRCL